MDFISMHESPGKTEKNLKRIGAWISYALLVWILGYGGAMGLLDIGSERLQTIFLSFLFVLLGTLFLISALINRKKKKNVIATVAFAFMLLCWYGVFRVILKT